MKILFIITASVAIKKCHEILTNLTKKNIFIDCIITNNAKKIYKIKEFKKIIKGKVYTDNSEKNNKGEIRKCCHIV